MIIKNNKLLELSGLWSEKEAEKIDKYLKKIDAKSRVDFKHGPRIKIETGLTAADFGLNLHPNLFLHLDPTSPLTAFTKNDILLVK